MNIYPWQLELLEKMQKYKGRGVIQMTGRQLGKSTFSSSTLKRMMDDIHNRPVEELMLSEGTVYGAKYYTVEPIGGNWLAMETWCVETFGSGSSPLWGEFNAPELAQRWYKNNRKFWFRDEKDRTMFILKWR